jgi:hypothetical protein
MTAEPVPIRPEQAPPLDLSAIVARHPIQVVYLDMAAVLNGLSVGDMIDLEATLGIGFADIATAPRMSVLATLAWLVGRRADPDLTIDHVRAYWRIELREDPTLPRQPKPRRSVSSRSRA